jgi:Cu2+-exporting ATPase
VLALGAIGFVGWFLATGDFARSIGVTTAILVVTCPCAFGIATPLAYDLAYAGLRRAGLYVRNAGFLDRAAGVRQVVFDKTGTLTSGDLDVVDLSVLPTLDVDARNALAAMVASSTHPKSAALHRALRQRGQDARPDGRAREITGQGVELALAGHLYKLGATAWVGDAPAERAASHDGNDVAFGVDGELLAHFDFRETLRSDARAEVAALQTEGLGVWLLSGDDSARVAQTAREVGIAADHAVGSCSPEEKEAWVVAHDRRDTLMVGDGINDALVVARAFCSGTPAIDRPFMAARSDFYFVTPGLRPIRLALDVAKRVARARRTNLRIAVAYNVLTVGLAYAGLMSPLACAVLMPASSLTVILITGFALSSRSRLWRS